jgi:RNA polymerase sigma-70 factor (family 1)
MTIVADHNEKTLLAMVAAGNRDAFAQLYTSHLDHLFRYIFLFTKSKEETEEILQEIFLKIWVNRTKLPELDSFKNYLYRVAKNKVLDAVRHIQVRHKVLSEIKRTKDIAVPATSDQCAYREYYRLVQHAIEKLPPKRKLIFRLNIENGLSLDEIAQKLNISRSVVQKQSSKATHFVREYLSKHAEISFSILLSFLLPAW